MIAQGAEPINSDYFTNLTNSINGVGSRDELQSVVNNSFSQLSQMKQAMISEQTANAPVLALLTPPSSPTEAITWISNFISGYLGPQAKPSVTYATQLAMLPSQISELTAAVNRAESRIGGEPINIPAI